MDSKYPSLLSSWIKYTHICQIVLNKIINDGGLDRQIGRDVWRVDWRREPIPGVEMSPFVLDDLCYPLATDSILILARSL
jgi:hypothetical protein